MAALSEFLGSDPFAHLDVPPQLEQSLARHRVHLAELAHAMKNAGVRPEDIERSVTELIASYKAELLAAIQSIER